MVLNVAVIGLGKLGAPLAACLALKGLRVIGVDTDPRKVEALSQGRAPVFEPKLAETIADAQARLSATVDTEAAVRSADVTFIVVPTPSEADGGFSLKYVLPACEQIGRALTNKEGFHLVVLTSTVMPGSTGGPVRAALERTSGKRCGTDFGLCYSPEFIALGSVVHDFLNPDFLLIGESDVHSGDLLSQLYGSVCDNKPPVARMNWVNAEIAKLAVNTYVTTKISFANMLARICERVPEASVDAVTRALGFDSRIGAKYLKGSVSYGGPCFPRDNLAVAAFARRVGAPSHVADATHQFNRWQITWLAELVARYVPKGGCAGILGLTYKPNTDVVEQAVGLLVAQDLAARGVCVLAHDPAGNANAAGSLDSSVRVVAQAEECISGSDVVVLSTPWPSFLEIPAERWSRIASPRVVIDCWRVLGNLENEPGILYLPLGLGREEGAGQSLRESVASRPA